MLYERGQTASASQFGRNKVPIKRLVSYVDAHDEGDTEDVSLAVRFEAELDDGELFPVLDDRGWSSSGTWSQVSSTEIEETARVVVGPDEPRDDETWQEAEASYWAYVRELLVEQGIEIDVANLRLLPHDVILTRRLLDRIEASSDGPDPDAN
ncbi:hypothetical protein [Promicromonospora panici]|uniref:hypothetical protein n=1 Tax=Promicromonospora panici TaxID=2219658 RepID=UPI00101BB39D|nr:hypothetical protein [Promicromonospora panici]